MRMLSTASSNCTLSLWVLAYITFCFMKLIYKTYHSNKGQGRHHNTGYKEMRHVQTLGWRATCSYVQSDQSSPTIYRPCFVQSDQFFHQQSSDHVDPSLCCLPLISAVFKVSNSRWQSTLYIMADVCMKFQ